MPKGIVEGLFLLGFWAPPLAVLLSALALLVRPAPAPRSVAHSRTEALTH